MAGIPGASKHDLQTQPLTAREVSVLRLAAEGKSNAEIGTALGVDTVTVKGHFTEAKNKLGAQDRTHAVVLAIRRGWLHLGSEGA